jgi:hypothetical protein
VVDRSESNDGDELECRGDTRVRARHQLRLGAGEGGVSAWFYRGHIYVYVRAKGRPARRARLRLAMRSGQDEVAEKTNERAGQ